MTSFNLSNQNQKTSGLHSRPRGQRDRRLRDGHRRRPLRDFGLGFQAGSQTRHAARPRPGPAFGFGRGHLEDRHRGERDGRGDGVRGPGRRGGASRCVELANLSFFGKRFQSFSSTFEKQNTKNSTKLSAHLAAPFSPPPSLSLLLHLLLLLSNTPKKTVIDAAGGSVWNSGGSVLSQLRASARDAATVALQAGSAAKERALAAAGSALEAGKGLAEAAIGAGKAALARATGTSGSGSGGAGESA